MMGELSAYTLTLQAPPENKVTLLQHSDVHEKLLHTDVFVLFNPVSQCHAL